MSQRKQLRVIHLGKYYPPATGGIESHTQTLCRSLQNEDVNVQVVVVNHLDRTGKDVTFQLRGRTWTDEGFDGDVQVHRVGRRANIAKLDVTPGLSRLLRQLRRNPPDLWHMHAPNITMMLALAGLRGIRPLVITHHSDIVRQRVLKHAVRPLERLIYGRATRIFLDAPGYAEGSTLLPAYKDKLRVLPLGIDLKPYQEPSAAAREYAAALRARHVAPLWLAAGRMIYYKALDIALKALQDVPGTLLVVGTGPMEETWKAKAVELGVDRRVVWLGRLSADEIVGAYQAATAFWFPSNARAEGFGLVQVEAMAGGRPVINAAIPQSGVAWVSPHEVSGLTVPVNDAASFAAAANRLVKEPGLYERLARGAAERAATEFDHRVMAARCRALYDECLFPAAG